MVLDLLVASVDAIEADLATLDGVDRLVAAAHGRSVDARFANAGHGLGRAFTGSVAGFIPNLGQAKKDDPATLAQVGFDANHPERDPRRDVHDKG